jgi:hypothetical protein
MFGAMFNSENLQHILSQNHLSNESKASDQSFISQISEIQQESNLNMGHQMGVELYMGVWDLLKSVACDDWMDAVDLHQICEVLSQLQSARELSLKLRAQMSQKSFILSGRAHCFLINRYYQRKGNFRRDYGSCY